MVTDFHAYVFMQTVCSRLRTPVWTFQLTREVLN
jgi:hypothetical protein